VFADESSDTATNAANRQRKALPERMRCFNSWAMAIPYTVSVHVLQLAY
jgi:hypothetical protein